MNSFIGKVNMASPSIFMLTAATVVIYSLSVLSALSSNAEEKLPDYVSGASTAQEVVIKDDTSNKVIFPKSFSIPSSKSIVMTTSPVVPVPDVVVPNGPTIPTASGVIVPNNKFITTRKPKLDGETKNLSEDKFKVLLLTLLTR